MNKNTAGAVLLLVIAAAGLVSGNAFAVAMVIVTCALTFITEELRDARHYLPIELAVIPAVASWLTTAAAALSLLF
jgi:hypothetical protein